MTEQGNTEKGNTEKAIQKRADKKEEGIDKIRAKHNETTQNRIEVQRYQRKTEPGKLKRKGN